jgi:hypothetical protein
MLLQKLSHHVASIRPSDSMEPLMIIMTVMTMAEFATPSSSLVGSTSDRVIDPLLY